MCKGQLGKEVGVFEGLQIGQCGWKTVSKGNTVQDEAGKTEERTRLSRSQLGHDTEFGFCSKFGV